MTLIYGFDQKRVGYGLEISKFGYHEVPETLLLMYDISDLNQDNLDFRSMKIKQVGNKVATTETGESIEWYEEDMREADISVVTPTSATQFTASVSTVRPGEQLWNIDTNETALVESVAGTTVTLVAPGFTGSGYAAGNTLSRFGFSKKYGDNDNFTATRNDLIQKTNYIQFTETKLDADLIENNKNYLFIKDANERAKMVFGDQSRKIMKNIAMGLFVGKAEKHNTWGFDRYTAGGLRDFVPASAKTNIKGVDNEDTKRKLRNELTKAYQSGVPNIRGTNKLLAFCTTQFADEIDRLYESKVYYQDKLKAIDVNITTYNVGGKKLNMVVSNLLDVLHPGKSICYLVPIDYTFIYMLPNGITADGGKAVENYGKGVVYTKPVTTYEKKEIALFAQWSYMFQNLSSGAFRILRYE